MRILHLSDTHLLANRGRHHGRDTTAALEEMLAGCERDVDVVIHTGDVSEDGSAQAYRKVHDLVQGWAGEVPVLWAVGNHDDGPTMAAELHVPLGAIAVHRVAGFRIIMIDSHRPGLVGGVVGAEQLGQLRQELSDRPGEPTVLALHHPPVDPLTRLQRGIRLHDHEALWELIGDFEDVRMVLAGHLHYHLHTDGVVGNRRVPVQVAPAITYLVDTRLPAERERWLVASGVVHTEIRPDGGWTSQVYAAAPDTRVKQDPDLEQVADVAEQLAAADQRWLAEHTEA
ncbi:metallophosphoesterase family protein [Parenemella sanctibonifatiensis]|uniref:Phosphohydrolase n=1 Tax=Parenemella sanctibonifatiensis TaxID=2016505 RepID=A0A255ECP1_9ACTN|nr:metallophosphoesterase [Parenemella sanctibonifatiensis]OYN89030.1 phosphohydrolase [Parenemella sanctibonifatiensis]